MCYPHLKPMSGTLFTLLALAYSVKEKTLHDIKRYRLAYVYTIFEYLY